MVVSWNAHVPGRRALDAVVDEVNDLVHKESGERRADIVCMQVIGAASEAKGDSPETPGYMWVFNDNARLGLRRCNSGTLGAEHRWYQAREALDWGRVSTSW